MTRILIALPPSLLNGVAVRLKECCLIPVLFPGGDHPEQVLIESQTLCAGDALLWIQPPHYLNVVALAQALCKQGIHYVDATLQDHPQAVTQGYLLMVSGDRIALNLLYPFFNALAPINDGWWHVGSFGAATFLSEVVKQTQIHHWARPARINFLSSLYSQLQGCCTSIASTYLERTQNEVFHSIHPERQRTIVPCLNDNPKESPARQIAMLLKRISIA